MAGRGGKNPGAGRPKGSLNKDTNEIKALAQVHGPAAIARLAKLSGIITDKAGTPIGAAESEATQVAAIKELLDRGYGKARQPVDHGLDGSLEDMLALLAP